MSFRTESALYYYYYKLLVNDPSTPIALTINANIISDDRTEFPQTINALERFNLYPEVSLAFFYRILSPFLSKNCWTVNRGEDLAPIKSCVGLAEPIYFYTNVVFGLHAASIVFLFTLAYLINNRSVLAALFGCLCFFYNHSEATRVMWTPALRESFSFPFYMAQNLALYIYLANPVVRNGCILSLATLLYLLPWQFAQFTLGTQVISLFFVYAVGKIDRQQLIGAIFAHLLALLAAFRLMFGNRMLLTSFYASTILSLVVNLATFELVTRKLPHFSINFKRFPLNFDVLSAVLVKMFSLIFVSVFIKNYFLASIFPSKDDSHIWDILKTKLIYLARLTFPNQFNYPNDGHTFDTRLYTCAKEFDFIELETLIKLTETLLLPVGIGVFLFYLFQLFSDLNLFNRRNKSQVRNNLNAFQVFMLVQTVAVAVIAILIMRLKLFFTPQLCLLASCLVGFVVNKLKFKVFMNKIAFIVLLYALISFKGIENLKKQHDLVGEYNDPLLESLIFWVNKTTNLNSSFAGAMPTMANLKLSTNRIIVNHPHYEDFELRQKTKRLYTHMYGYKSINQLHKVLKCELKVNYLVLERHFCLSHPPRMPQCAMVSVVHLDSAKDSSKQACDVLISGNDKEYAKKFKRVFEKGHYYVFKVL